MEVFAIILGALIGGGCTIAAAYITVNKRFDNQSYEPNGFAKTFIKFFSIFKEPNKLPDEMTNTSRIGTCLIHREYNRLITK